jgi:flagellar hook-associated protein 2
MVDSINLNNLSVGKDGRVTLGGLSSGIDYQAAIDAIIAARRIPVDSLENRVTANEERIAAYKDLSSLLSGLKDSLSELRGAVTFGGTGNAFKAKTAFATTSRADGGTASVAANLLGVTVTNAAATGSHTVEILQTAASHKIGSGALTSTTDDLGTALGLGAGTVAGSFDVNGVTIDVLSTDTMQDVRDRINAANTGSNATGVTASIVSAGVNQHYLVLTSDATGETITLDNEVGGVLGQLGISNDGGTTLLNELQAPRTAKLYADGLLDISKWQSAAVASSSAAVSGYAGVTAGAHSFEILDSVGGVIATVNYDDADNLTDIANTINGLGAGVTAEVVADGSSYRLHIEKDDGAAISLGNDTDNLLTGLGVAKQNLLIERSTNTINDLFAGVTLNLYQAEAGTTVKLDVERDLTAVKTAVVSFVDAYNAVKQFVNQQNLTNEETGGKSADAGPLFGARTLNDVESTLSRLLGQGTAGVDSAFRVLAQIGVKFIDNDSLSDPLLADTLEIDESVLDEALLNNPEDVRRLFGFDMSTSDPRITLLGFTGNTTYNAAGYTLNLTHDGTSLTGANINGVAGSATVNGNIITITDATGANGLQLFYSGNTDATGIQIDFTVGLAVDMFADVDAMIDSSTGAIQGEIDTLTDQNEVAEERIDEMLRRLDYQREQLTNKFIAMETSLSTMNRILDSIKQTVDGWYADN